MTHIRYFAADRFYAWRQRQSINIGNHGWLRWFFKAEWRS